MYCAGCWVKKSDQRICRQCGSAEMVNLANLGIVKTIPKQALLNCSDKELEVKEKAWVMLGDTATKVAWNGIKWVQEP